MYVIADDIVERLSYRKPYWHHGKPQILLFGDEATFGWLEFDFQDVVVVYNVYIKDKDAILNAAMEAIENFTQICNRLWEQN
jgi:hypothetical protein